MAEPFFGTFNNEMRHLRDFVTLEEVRAASVEYVEGYNNRRRSHSTTGHQILAEKMDAFLACMDAVKEAVPLAA